MSLYPPVRLPRVAFSGPIRVLSVPDAIFRVPDPGGVHSPGRRDALRQVLSLFQYLSLYLGKVGRWENRRLQSRRAFPGSYPPSWAVGQAWVRPAALGQRHPAQHPNVALGVSRRSIRDRLVAAEGRAGGMIRSGLVRARQPDQYSLLYIHTSPLYREVLYRTAGIETLTSTDRTGSDWVDGGRPPLEHAAQHPNRPLTPRASENATRVMYGSHQRHTDRMNDPVGVLPTSQRTSLRASPVAFRPSPLPRVGHRGVTAWMPPALPQFSGLPSIVPGPEHRPNPLLDGEGVVPKSEDSRTKVPLRPVVGQSTHRPAFVR